ncbi:MAG: RHS repeat protein [Deltaproteobacteria bacterium]|nr:RHS repeat protein [Deltaproteobacteria bacterium]
MNGTALLLAKRVFLLLQCLICVFSLQPFAVSAESVSYLYDTRHRLIGATYDSGVAISYTYDAAGNRLNETITSNAPGALTNTPASVTSLNRSAQLNDSANTSSNPNGSANLQRPGSQNGNKSGSASTLGSDRGDTQTPSTIIYEDAEHGDTARWGIYDGPSGAYINNIYDRDRGSRVIELNGNGLLNGYVLLKEDGSWWNDSDHKVIQWSMKYTEDFVVSVAVLTTSGLRYLSFTPENVGVMGTGTDIFNTLGVDSKNGTWRTYVIDLGYVLHEAQPNTTLLSLLGFSIRGSGLLDDIQAHKEIPAGLNSDGDGVTDIIGN